MKKVFQILLAIAIVGLGYYLYDSVMTPVRFQNEVKKRQSAVVERIKDIRLAQQAYKQKYQRYTGDFDSLIDFVLNDSLVFVRSFGSKDDSVAVAKGRFKEEQFMVAVKDTVFGAKKLSVDQVRELPYIPYGENQAKYILAAGNLMTGAGVNVPVFECKAPFKMFLADLDHQQLINLIDEQINVMSKYPGIKVGSMTEATNDAGNWE